MGALENGIFLDLRSFALSQNVKTTWGGVFFSEVGDIYF